MKVVLAEKPSVARDIASILGANTKKDGYLEGNGWAVTWAFGHLVQIAEPESMNAAWGKPWQIEQLPMIPGAWKYRIADKADAQFNVIKKLFSDPATNLIVCATDAGREGEHIFRLIYQMAGSKKPVERLWISSLTAEAIKDGFSNLKPSRAFDNLADAASARSHADWIVGLNFTRAYTVLNRQLCTVGRVQTPTLALIVDRQQAIDNFKPVTYFEITATFEPGFMAKYITPEAEPQTRIPAKVTAEKILSDITLIAAGTVEKIETKEQKTRAPGLYDLLTLQKDANKRFGYTAQETLDLAQSLYEEFKILSYPRTESRHLSTDMVSELPAILNTLLKASNLSQEAKNAFSSEGIVAGNVTADQLRQRLTKSHVDDTKLTDHHAIIPTHKTPPVDLPEKQRNVYSLVVTRFLSIFLPPEIRDETEALIRLASHLFRAKGVVIKDPGWTILEPKEKNKESDKAKDSEDAQQLPPLQQNQKVSKRKAEIKEGKTTPPKPYDDASLLTAMKTAGKELDDEDLAAYMKQSGLGTAATRAQIIERLLHSAYIERSKRSLLPTEKGKALIASVHPNLKNVALTARWEQQLSDMVDGKVSLSKFEEDIASFLRWLLPEVTKQGATISKPVEPGLGPCPMCKQGTIRKTPKGAGCDRWKEGCKFMIWREQFGKKLTESQIQELLEKGKTKVIKGFKKRDGSGTYDARLVLTDEFKIKLDFDKN
ncbi:MAG TPA: DNA topoisomerase 3 [Oculatellaceae cyanobacterium]